MILAEAPGGTRFVTQPDHAALAGTFADHWGGVENDRIPFQRPAPSSAVRFAAHAHDDGWWSADREPRLDDGTPLAFHDVPASRWTRLYRDGIDEVARVDYYAGLLVSLHGSGLRRRRYGLSPSWEDTPRRFRGFVRREERRQRSLAASLRDAADDDRLSAADATLLDALHETGSPPDGEPTDESNLWFNYRLLQAVDSLSLQLCSTVVTDPESASPITVERAPTTLGGPETTLTAEPVDEATYRLSPFPFDESPVACHVPARTVATDGVDDDRSLLDAYYAADRETIRFALRRVES